VTTSPTLAERVVHGEQGAIARVLTQIERRTPGVNDLLAELHRHATSAHVLGVTGPPGSGKSTLVAALTAHYRKSGRTVGIIAVDPSSAFTGGAILGDRIRMSPLAGDPGVFIRSIATRGALGGLSRAAMDAITVLDAAGNDVIILETVGVGQAEVDVISAAHSVAVVSVPGMGDGVQAIKAGLLEIADVHVVNKADREGTHKTVTELREMIRLARRRPGQWNIPIQQTVATTGVGVGELADQFDAHGRWMAANGEQERRVRRHTATRIRWAAEEMVLERLQPGNPDFDQAVDEVTTHRGDPISAARRLIKQL
jgi:LAO/AO transport system kinase